MNEENKTPKELVLSLMRNPMSKGKVISAYLRRYFKINNYYRKNYSYNDSNKNSYSDNNRKQITLRQEKINGENQKNTDVVTSATEVFKNEIEY